MSLTQSANDSERAIPQTPEQLEALVKESASKGARIGFVLGVISGIIVSYIVSKTKV